MWLGSVFKMRMSILNTATTEQMGYGSISFFCVLAPEGMNAIVFGGGRRGRNQKTTACSEDISSRRLFSLFNERYREMTCHFTKNKVVTFRVVLLRDVHHVMYDTHREKHYIATK